MNEKLVKLENEVKELHSRVIMECENNAALKSLYKGVQIFYSPFIEKADVMLIGINPGAGFSNANGEIVIKFDPLPTHDDTNIVLDIKWCFNQIKKDSLINKTVVTNTYFFATYGTTQLGDFLSQLSSELKKDLIEKSIHWLKELIELISPKLILCAGTSVFEHFEKNYKNDMVTTQGKGYLLEGTYKNIPVLADRRVQGGNFKSIKEFADKIGEYIVKYNIGE